MATKPPDDHSSDALAGFMEFDLGDGDQPPRTIHDAFFKKLLDDPANAAAVLQAILPPRIARHIDWTSLDPQHASVVSDQFQQQHGDMLFAARLEAGGDIFLWLLFEHQSSVDYWMIRRLLEFSVKLWQRWHARHPDARLLPAILPVVLYHGREPWSAPTSFLDLYDLTAEARQDLADYLLSYRFWLDDLRAAEDPDIKARPVGPFPRLGLVTMKHGPAADIADHLLDLHEDIRALMATEQGRAKMACVMLYIWNVNPYVDRETLMRRLIPVAGPELENTMLTYAQKLKREGFDQGLEQGLEKGIEQGLEQGLEKGIEQGQRALLRRLLERRFGTMPENIVERIEHAGSDDIDRWSTRILEADSLEDVFTP